VAIPAWEIDFSTNPTPHICRRINPVHSITANNMN
jgi:hypothetical protein